MIEHMFKALKMNSQATLVLQIQLFLAVCIGPDSKDVKSLNKQRKYVYIPGETTEQRRIKRQAIQNGALLAAHLVQIMRQDTRDLLSLFYQCLDEAEVLIHVICLLDFLVTHSVKDISDEQQIELSRVQQFIVEEVYSNSTYRLMK